MKTVLRGASGLAILLLAACATTGGYQGVAETEPGAVLIFEKGYKSNFFLTATVGYTVATEPVCKRELAASLLWTSSNEKRVRAAADRKITVSASTTYTWTTPSGYQTYTVHSRTCAVHGSFTPRDGRHYRVVHTAASMHGACPLKVVDASTNLPPSDYRPLREWACASELAPKAQPIDFTHSGDGARPSSGPA